MASTNSVTHSLSEQDRASVWHPFTQMQTANLAIPIVRGNGIYLYAEDGKRYIDGISSWWVNLHGHAHPDMIAAIKAQGELLEHVIFADFTHAPAVKLAVRLLDVLPGNMSKIFYSDNGSTAVEVAIKMAIQFWHNDEASKEKTRVICFKHGYHGDTFGAMSAAGRNPYNTPFWKHLFEVDQIDPPAKGKEKESLAQLEAILKKGQSACFIFEPLVLAAGGMMIHTPEALSALMNLCKQYDVLTIADEVMTGFGRLQTLFACEQLTESPDLICVSKGITGGFLPLGVTACQKKIYNRFLGDSLKQAFLHGHSYTANPLACSSALASLDLLLKDSCYSQRQMIADCHKRFCLEFGKHPKLKRCESIGTLLVLEYFSEESYSYFHSLRDHLYKFFLEAGILLRPIGNVVYVLPAFCIQENELQIIYDKIIQTLENDL